MKALSLPRKEAEMTDIIIRALCFIAIILFGYLLKKAGLLKKEDGQALSKIVLNFTLPCAIISNFASFEVNASLLIFTLFSFIANGILLFTGYFVSRKKSDEDKVYYMLAVPGYNIGNFTMPFVSSMIGPAGAIAACLFDTSNAIYCNGLDYAMAGAVVKGNKVKVGEILKPLVKIISFMTYIIFIILSLVHFPVPQPIFTFASLGGAANAPCTMLMFGLLLEPRFSKDSLTKIFSVIGIRYLVAIAFSLFYVFVLDFPHEVIKGAIIVLFSPVSGVASAFSLKLGGDTELMGLTNTLSVLVSFVVITLLVVLL